MYPANIVPESFLWGGEVVVSFLRPKVIEETKLQKQYQHINIQQCQYIPGN